MSYKKSKNMFISTVIMVPNPNPEEYESDEMELDVEAELYCEAGFSGSYWQPPEGPEVVLQYIHMPDGQKLTPAQLKLTSEQIEDIQNQAADELCDGYSDQEPPEMDMDY